MARLELHRGQPLSRGEVFTFEWDDQEITAYPGETILGALLAADIRTLRRTERKATPRGMFCGIGVCFDCLVMIDGAPEQRACIISAAPGMRVQSTQPSTTVWAGVNTNE